jgi:UDP-N-acetyl-D-galactosamine dehydrogenase
MSITNKKIAVIGLGYVGLPLTLAFAKKYSTIGFDVNSKRIAELHSGNDITKEVNHNELVSAISNSVSLELTNDSSRLQNSDVYIVTVPTPVDHQKLPDLTFLLEAKTM